jgi:sugar phosphate isomerase/epimerase
MWGDGTIRFTRAIEILHDDNWHGFLNVCYTDEDPNEVLKRYADGLFAVLHSVTGTGDTATELLESPQPPE